MTAHPIELVERLRARPRLVDYNDLDLDEVDPRWCVLRGRRHEPLPRDFLVHEASWGAYERELEQLTDQVERLKVLNDTAWGT